MPAEALDPFALLRALHEHGVDYIVVGGFAVNAHGFIRATSSILAVPGSSNLNVERRAESPR